MTIRTMPLAVNWMRGLRFFGHIDDARTMPMSIPKMRMRVYLITSAFSPFVGEPAEESHYSHRY